MFQRQLSTTALTSQRPQSGPNQTGQQRLFQRQVTTSQLLSSTASNDGMSSKQRAAALLAAARDPDRASSSLTLSGQTSGVASRSPPSPALAPFRFQQPQPQPLSHSLAHHEQVAASTAAGVGVEPKKPAKNKRIISRMLSISAIHTTPSVAAALADSGPHHQHQHQGIPTAKFNDQPLLLPHHHHQAELAGSATTAGADQVAGENLCLSSTLLFPFLLPFPSLPAVVLHPLLLLLLLHLSLLSQASLIRGGTRLFYLH